MKLSSTIFETYLESNLNSECKEKCKWKLVSEWRKPRNRKLAKKINYT